MAATRKSAIRYAVVGLGYIAQAPYQFAPELVHFSDCVLKGRAVPPPRYARASRR